MKNTKQLISGRHLSKGIKWMISGICLLSIGSCVAKHAATGSKPGAGNSLKVMTYNIHHANPPSRAGYIDVDAVANVIRGQEPDLVAIQEVDVHTRRSGKDISEAEVLAAKTGMKVYFAKSIDFDGGDYGIVILSRNPISDMHTYKLPTAEGTKGEPRVLATAKVSLPGHEIIFACTHLDAEPTDTNRILQIHAIAGILKKETLPVVIGGDFNSGAKDRTINILDQQLERTCRADCGFTIPSDRPNETIDYIAFTPGIFKVMEHKVLQEAYASDHLPVIATLHF